MFDRRTILAAIASLPTLIAPGLAAKPMPLMQEARHAGMLFGCAVRADQIFADIDFQALVLAECGEITPELELKWDYLEPKHGQFNFSGADALADFAGRHRIALHGHTLLWDQAMPVWAKEALTRDTDWSFIARYFAALLPRYQKMIATWDVVNEPIDVVSGRDGMRISPFLEAFGTDYVGRALKEAHKYVPKAKLFINEYGLIYNIPEARAKRAALLKLIDSIQADSLPLDGIGVQAHLELEYQPSFDAAAFADFLNELGARNLEVRISELDVKENQTDLPFKERDQRAADAVAEVLKVAVANRAVGTITSWGLSDRYSWLPAAKGEAGYNRGLPFNTDLQEKPLYRAIKKAMQQRQPAV